MKQNQMEFVYKGSNNLISNIDFSSLVKVNRSVKDIGLFGRKGIGKTTVLSLIGFINFLNNADVYSSYHLNFPHILIKDFNDFEKIRFDGKKKVFLGDDFEGWFHKRNFSKALNKDMNEILLNWGKKNCSLIYSCKNLDVDKAIRDNTTEFWNIILKQKYYHPDKKKNDILKSYLNFLYIEIERYDLYFERLPSIYIYNLDLITQLFSTKEIVKKLKDG